jgi:protein O-GlcNAc transferase
MIAKWLLEMPSAWVSTKANWWKWCGRNEARRRNFVSAISYFRRVLEFLPKSVYTLCYLGFCLSEEGRQKEALSTIDRALQVKPDCAYAHAQLGRLFMEMERPQEAADSLARSFRIEPQLRTEPAYILVFAKALGATGRANDARLAYEEAAKLDPRDVEAQAGIGWQLFEDGKYQDAEQPFRNAIEINPDYAYAYDMLGRVLRELGRHEESIPVWQSLVALRPMDRDAHLSLGWALGAVGRHRESLASLSKALELGPAFPAYYSIGLCHAQLLEYGEAIEAEEQAIPLAPDTEALADAYSVLAAALLGLEDYDRAIRASQQALELNPMLQEAWHNLGEAYFKEERFENAANSFEKLFQYGPGIPDSHLMLGLALLKLGRKAAALEECEFLKTLDANQEKELRDAIASTLP